MTDHLLTAADLRRGVELARAGGLPDHPHDQSVVGDSECGSACCAVGLAQIECGIAPHWPEEAETDGQRETLRLLRLLMSQRPDILRLVDGVRPDGSLDLVGASLAGAHIARARLDDARLDRASLVGAHLGDARLDGASLVGASLYGAVLVGASLVGARLDRASLVGASLVGASLVGAHLGGADLRGATLDGHDVADLRARGALVD